MDGFPSRPSVFLPKSYAQALRRRASTHYSPRKNYASALRSNLPATSNSPSSFRHRRDEGLLLASDGCPPSSSGSGVALGERDSASGGRGRGVGG